MKTFTNKLIVTNRRGDLNKPQLLFSVISSTKVWFIYSFIARWWRISEEILKTVITYIQINNLCRYLYNILLLQGHFITNIIDSGLLIQGLTIQLVQVGHHSLVSPVGYKM